MEGRPPRMVSRILLATVGALLATAAPASAGEILGAATYPDMTTFECRTGEIPISPGQNLNLYTAIKTCPNAEKVAGSGPVSASVFDPGSSAQGYITRFKPSMVEIKGSGKLVTPSVWDLHLHHVVWLGPNQRFGAGEEKTIAKAPQGYGGKVGADQTWGLNYMIHSLNASSGRSVYITWEIDWVPETTPARTDITATQTRWLNVAGSSEGYPVFDAERGFDTDGDGEFVFPDDALDPSDPAFEEEGGKISNSARWVVPAGGVTLVSGGGHLHPGGLHVDLEVARDGPDPDSIDGDDPSEVRPLFRSDARYYEPAGAVSWDVSMKVTRPEWRISLTGGDTVSIDATYDVEKASWYESMGILPLAYTTVDDSAAKDPFDDEAAVREMYDAGGILTHGRLDENIDAKARKNLGLPDPRDLKSKGRVPDEGIDIDGFVYRQGGYSANPLAPVSWMRPPRIDAGETVSFNNLDAASAAVPQTEQAWHSITSCKPPCNRGSGVGYPLASGPIKFDSGQLGFGNGLSTAVTTGTSTYETPPLTDPGTYTYFCRIHPFMRGSIRVQDE